MDCGMDTDAFGVMLIVQCLDRSRTVLGLVALSGQQDFVDQIPSKR